MADVDVPVPAEERESRGSNAAILLVKTSVLRAASAC
jgi:hypothetical protein